jgi:hypothetical protein
MEMLSNPENINLNTIIKITGSEKPPISMISCIG